MTLPKLAPLLAALALVAPVPALAACTYTGNPVAYMLCLNGAVDDVREDAQSAALTAVGAQAAADAAAADAATALVAADAASDAAASAQADADVAASDVLALDAWLSDVDDRVTDLEATWAVLSFQIRSAGAVVNEASEASITVFRLAAGTYQATLPPGVTNSNCTCSVIAAREACSVVPGGSRVDVWAGPGGVDRDVSVVCQVRR